jgi:hypothetical protein
VRAAYGGHGEDGNEDAEGLTGGDGHPTGAVGFGFVEESASDNAIAEQDEQGGAEEFTDSGEHVGMLNRTAARTRKNDRYSITALNQES